MSKRKPTYEQLRNEYTKLLSFNITRVSDVKRAAAKLLGHSARYQEVERLTGVPWQFVAVIHYRESNCDFSTHLHNGDPLTTRTRRVPAGRPKVGNPPFTWVESAVDALKQKGLDKNTDWSMERMCYELERYNGFGYRMYHPTVLSPYLWSGTTNYTSGKYVADGKFDNSVRDKQLGVIPILQEIMKSKREIVKEVVNNSRKLTILQRVRNAIVATVSSVMALDWLEMLGQVKQFATDNAGLLIAGTAATAWLVFKLIEQYSIQDYKDGRYIPSGEKGDDATS